MTTQPTGRFRWIFPPPVVGLAWIVVCAALDWLTGPELSISAFYLAGPVLVAWLCNRKLAVIMAFCTALAWLIPELAFGKNYSHPYIPYWNAFIRLGFFLFTVFLISEVRSRRRTEAALAAQDSMLRSILDSMGDGVVVTNSDGIVIVFNPAAEKLFGSNPIGRDAMRWVTELEQFRIDEFIADTSRSNPIRLSVSGQLFGTSELSLSPVGVEDTKVLGLTTQPLTARDRKTAGVVMVISDLTARRALEKQIAEATEREQCRIGQDLHDGVCQHLVSVAFAAGSLQSQLESLSLDQEAKAAGKIAVLINEAITEARNLAHGLYPAGLIDGIEVALQTIATTTRERTGIDCQARIDRDLPPLDPVSTVHLYRIAQEAISNACRHGMPDTIEISLRTYGHHLRLTVADNGKGMEEKPTNSRGMGLNLMLYRANLIGGVFEIISGPGKGTRIICSLPPTKPNQPAS